MLNFQTFLGEHPSDIPRKLMLRISQSVFSHCGVTSISVPPLSKILDLPLALEKFYQAHAFYYIEWLHGEKIVSLGDSY